MVWSIGTPCFPSFVGVVFQDVAIEKYIESFWNVPEKIATIFQ